MSEENEGLVMSYLDELGVSSVIRNRVLEIEDYYITTLPGRALTRVYVSETVDDEGQRILENLWFFFEDIWCEAHNFQVEDKFDITRMDEISYIVSERHEYKTGVATTRSRLAVNFKIGSTNMGMLKASGENCNTLSSITTELLLPRVTGVVFPRG